MLVEDLIALLQTLPAETDVLSPVADKGFAGDFRLVEKVVMLDAPGKASGTPPYTPAAVGEVGSLSRYILDCYWVETFGYDERTAQ